LLPETNESLVGIFILGT